jgi:hypothetical protein
MLGNIFSECLMLGAKSDQKLAAIITPPVNPSMVSKTALLMLLKKKTREAPKAVKNQVNKVASNAALTGPISIAKFSMVSIIG